jgi:hypothetical protein
MTVADAETERVDPSDSDAEKNGTLPESVQKKLEALPPGLLRLP